MEMQLITERVGGCKDDTICIRLLMIQSISESVDEPCWRERRGRREGEGTKGLYEEWEGWVRLAKRESSSRIMCNWGAVICQMGRVSYCRDETKQLLELGVA
jgi:hypothetical protein